MSGFQDVKSSFFFFFFFFFWVEIHTQRICLEKRRQTQSYADGNHSRSRR